MKRNARFTACLLLSGFSWLGVSWGLPFGFAEEGAGNTPPVKNSFFAFCFDQHDARQRTLAQQAGMIKRLGFDGVGHVGLEHLEERLQSLDAVGLQLFLAGTNLDPMDPPANYLPGIQHALPLLKDRSVVLYLILDGQPPNDQAAVAALRRIAEVAASWNVRVALYPHTGNWVSRVDHAVRLAKLVQRPNFGVIFNLCHWLKNEGPGHLRETLEAALPYLFAVTINGADPAGQDDPDWGRLIQPLDRGTYDVPALLRTLRGLDYHGPIGLMCWAIPGDAQDHLQRSIQTWHQWTGK